jgi:hypothetical protein
VGATQIDTAYSLWNKSGSDITYTAGNVGIGGTPVKTLSILPTSIRRMDFYVRNAGVDDALVIRSQHATNNNIRDMILEGSFLRFFTGADSGSSGTEAVRIDSYGRVSIGASAVLSSEIIYALANTTDFGSRIYNSNSSSPNGLILKYTGASPNNTGNNMLISQDSTTTRFYFSSNGGLNNYSANNTNLSDQREKKDIALAPSYLNKICAIPVKTFLYNDQTDTDLNLGVIAQDVQAVAPELIMESNWGTEEEPKMRISVYQTDLQYALMKCIQELKTINDTQAETINALTARIEALENR